MYAPDASGRSLVERVRLHGAVFEEGELLRIEEYKGDALIKKTIKKQPKPPSKPGATGMPKPPPATKAPAK